MDFDIEQHTIFMTLSGSRSYGTCLPTSDTDYKGIAIPPREYFHGYAKNFEQAIELVSKGNEFDRTIYSLKKFFRLAADCNPNVIEVLFTPAWCHTVTTEWSDLLIENRDLFLSKKARFTFSGYAHSQLKRIKGHKHWLDNPPKGRPTRKEFGLPEGKRVLKKSEVNVVPALEKLGYEFSKEAITALQKERGYLNAIENWKRYEHWKKNRNPDRANMEASYGYDLKHAMHLLRLSRMCVEILSGEGVQVERPDSDELTAIRKGSRRLDSIIEEAEELESKAEQLYKTSTLPKSPPVRKLDALCCNIVESFLSSKGL